MHLARASVTSRAHATAVILTGRTRLKGEMQIAPAWIHSASFTARDAAAVPCRIPQSVEGSANGPPTDAGRLQLRKLHKVSLGTSLRVVAMSPDAFQAIGFEPPQAGLTEMEIQNGLSGYGLKLKLARVYCGGITIRYERAIPKKGNASAVRQTGLSSAGGDAMARGCGGLRRPRSRTSENVWNSRWVNTRR
jgi:hypothetical protein